MESILKQMLELVTTNPGNLAYHLVVAFSIVGTLPPALAQWRNTGFVQNRRMVIGLIVLLILQVFLFTASAFAWIVPLIARFLAPFDSLVTLLSLVIVIWMWVFPESSTPADIVTFFISVIAILLLVGILVWWRGQPEGTFYNASWADRIGEFISAGVILLGIFLLLLRRPNLWGIGLSMFGLLFVGHLLHYLAPNLNSDLPGWVRLSQMASYPLLLILPQRFTIGNLRMQNIQRAGGYALDPKTLKALLRLTGDLSHKTVYQDITFAISQIFQADFCLLLAPPDDHGLIALLTGYDRKKDQTITPAQLDSQLTPMLKQSLIRARSLRLPSSSTTTDLVGLGQSLGLQNTGSLLAGILKESGKPPAGGIVLLLPYTSRNWTVEDQNYLTHVADLLVPIFINAGKTLSAQEEDRSLRTQIEALSQNTEQLTNEKQDLRRQLEALRAEA